MAALNRDLNTKVCAFLPPVDPQLLAFAYKTFLF